jgi:hypothetical protein
MTDLRCYSSIDVCLKELKRQNRGKVPNGHFPNKSQKHYSFTKLALWTRHVLSCMYAHNEMCTRYIQPIGAQIRNCHQVTCYLLVVYDVSVWTALRESYG